MKEQYISDFLPFRYHITDDIIVCENGHLVCSFRLEGKSHQTASNAQLTKWTDDLNNTFRTIGAEYSNIAMWTHVVRKRAPKISMNQEHDNYFAKKFNDNYMSSFGDNSLMINELYLTVVFRNSSSDATVDFLSRFIKLSAQERQADLEARVSEFCDLLDTVEKAFHSYGVERLRYVERENGIVFSEPAEFFCYVLNKEHINIPVTKDFLSNQLPQNRIIFDAHGEYFEIKQIEKSVFGGILEIKEYTEETYAGQLNQLLNVDFEFTFTQSFSFLDRTASVGFMNRQKTFLEDAKDFSESQIEQLKQGMDDIASGRYIMGEHHTVLNVYGDSIKAVSSNLATARNIFSNEGIIAVPSDLALEASYWSQFPCNWDKRTRPSVITSQNFLCFSSFNNFMTGKPKGNPWGDALAILKTTSGTPIFFNFHCTALNVDSTGKRPLGNTLIFGKSGTGKSVILASLLVFSLKYNPKIVVLDKDRGLEVLVRAIGGKYSPIMEGIPTGFNPFQLPDNEKNRAFIKRLLVMLIESSDRVTSKDEFEISNALNAVYLLDQSTRNISTLLENLNSVSTFSDSDTDRASVSERLAKWARGGEYGWVFDNDEDMLDLTKHRIYGFDVTDFLDNKDLCAPINLYLNYRINEMIDGEPFIMAIDEFWKAMQNESLADDAYDNAKTIRKKNGLMIYCTQEPADLSKFSQGVSIAKQCSTLICLPQSEAEHEDYVGTLKLSESEYETFKSLNEASRQFLIKQGDVKDFEKTEFFTSAIATLDLRNCSNELSVLSSSADLADLVNELIKEHGDKPENWIPRYYEALKNGVEI